MKHPYLPNGGESTRAAMLAAVGLENTDQLYADIPEALRLRKPLDLPERIASEWALEKHAEEFLAQNKPVRDGLCFLGAGCYRHFIPAVCDEIAARSEFRTAYAGEPYDDHGRFQALFEYQSLMAELLCCEVVNVPAMDGAQAAATAIRMAARMTGRNTALVSADIHPDKKKIIQNYCEPALRIVFLEPDARTGQLLPETVARAITDDTACVYLESPSFLGVLPLHFQDIARIARSRGAETVAGCEPALLGVLESPMNMGADIVCGDIQSLGVRMQFGGGQAGFIGTRDDIRYVREYPSRLFGVTRTRASGEWGFGDVYYERTSFADRERGKEYVGTQAALHGITAGVYLALLGACGMERLGARMLANARYLAERLMTVKGVTVRYPAHANELVADLNDTGRAVADVQAALRARGMLFGYDLSRDFPALGQSALVCVTEVQEKADIDALIAALSEVLA